MLYMYYNMIICISKSLNHHYLQWHVFYLYLPAEQVMPNQHIADTFFDLDILWHASFWYFPVHRQVESQLRQNSTERDTISGWQFFQEMICFGCNTFPFSYVHYYRYRTITTQHAFVLIICTAVYDTNDIFI